MRAAPQAVLAAPLPDGARGWLLLDSPVEVLQTRNLTEVSELLDRVEAAVAGGRLAAGLVSFEAAPAFDQALRTHPPGDLPLAWFALFDTWRTVAELPPAGGERFTLSPWSGVGDGEDHRRAVAAIRARIARGDTYQVNHTYRLRADFDGSPWALFARLHRAQPEGSYAAYLDLGRHALCSVSPELFFRLDGERIRCRPMKGTAARGLTWEADRRRAAALRRSPKNRAENLMIVDMVRNDLGRIARPGSVEVARLFDVERYDSLLQLTSTVGAETTAGLAEIFTALFPSASITGAPKIASVDIIRQLEPGPRGIYTGAIGYLAPGRRAQFNVAIRTVHVDREVGRAEYGTGGGIVWGSRAGAEQSEGRTKALILTRERPLFRLLETFAWRPARGYLLLARHLRRLAASARYFGLPCRPAAIRAALARGAAGFADQPRRVRLLLDERGGIELEAEPLPATRGPWRVTIARHPVDPGDRFLYHKTTHRQVYDEARRDAPGYDDVLLWNDRGEITESTLANLVVQIDGALVTPPVDCGLLPGTLRAELLARGRLRERVIRRQDLARARGLYLINSVRGWIVARLDPPGPAMAEEP